MTRWSPTRAILTIALSLAAWLIVAVACTLVGSSGVIGWPTEQFIAIARRERVLLASLVGAALASAGVVYQAILRNPLADPYLLGASTGASLSAYLWQCSFTTTLLASATAQVLSQQTAAFVGACVSVAIVLVLASSRGRLEPITLLLVGVIVNAVNASVFLLVNSLSREMPGSGGPLAFLVGGINPNLTPQQFRAAAALVAAALVAMLYLSGQLNVAALGESESQSLGVHIQRLRWVALIIGSLITAAAVSVSGPIGFIGLVCPHLGRLIVGGDTRRLLPVATAIGAALLCLADAATRLLAAQPSVGTALPVGVLTSMLGGPFFLLLLWRNRRRVNLGGG